MKRPDIAFRKWWDSQPQSFRDRADAAVAQISFRHGFATGRQANLDRYVFTVGRFRITVYATGLIEAKRKAASEADFRAASKGWKRPKGGWTVKEIERSQTSKAATEQTGNCTP
ncbi:hypothetical protein QTL95_01575 [Rhizobium sp. S152]|nr:hypothetical protein [Rhizobium sp. S152]MDM9624566.1 hypothetical protein [Rhizobium sp. S152]